MIADRFWELLSKRAFAEANELELKEFEELLLQNPHLKEIAEPLTVLSLQARPPEHNPEAEIAFGSHIRRLKEMGIEFTEPSRQDVDNAGHLGRKNIRRQLRRWGFVVAAVSITGFVFILKYNVISPRPAETLTMPLSQVTTKPASKTQIQLPDGSSVWLNASSNLTYDKDFGKEYREVNLTGEGFFDVVKDPSHPFIIHTRVIDVKVLGTEFNVKAYPTDAYTETSLIRGSVEITVKNRPNEKHYLRPNEKMSVANDILNEQVHKAAKPEPLILTQPLTYVQSDSSVIETSWVNNRFVFQQNETFREIAVKMERWYGVHIAFNYAAAGDEYRPFGSFQHETITQALDALKEGYKFNYKIDGNNITIIQ